MGFNFLSFKSQLKSFLSFLKKDRNLGLQVGLFIIILSLIPTQNFYAKFKAVEGRPVVRAVDIDIPSPPPYPVNSTGVPAPFLSAYSALVLDTASSAIIFQKNPDFKLYPASTTKIMTGLTALEHWDLDEVITVGEVSYIGQVMELIKGEKITVENLLYGVLVHSANDAAMVLADSYPGGEEAFVTRMNQKALELNLFNTHFTNPTGLEAWDHITTVHDLAVLTAAALENKTFSKMVGTKNITVYSLDGEISHKLKNINELLGEVEGLKGVKTGWTELSGECLVALVERGERKIITVLLKSNDRFSETKNLIDWVFANFTWEKTSLL
jgi:serine-type D-Ala-D-Ala carboxypeptidase (penicillin-binding protein 5/6)